MAEQDIIELIREDHQEVRELFARIDTADVDERAELFNTIVGELARHEAAEEAIVHPTLRDEAEGGPAITERVLEQENEAEDVLARMEKMDPASSEFLDTFRSLRDDVLAHADHEEREEHPRLRDAVSQSRLQEMADGWTRLKDMGPTRPHPHTPQKPEVRAALGPVAGAFDRARDTVREVLPG